MQSYALSPELPLPQWFEQWCLPTVQGQDSGLDSNNSNRVQQVMVQGPAAVALLT